MNYFKIDEEGIEHNLRYKLENFPLYSDGDIVSAHNGTFLNRDFLNIRYHQRNETFDRETQTCFDLEISDDYCLINQLGIEPGKRRRGYGRDLVKFILNFCSNEFLCVMYGAVASGQGAQEDLNGKCFWEKSGFSYNGSLLEKEI